MDKAIGDVVRQYNLDITSLNVSRIGTGHINHTFKLEGAASFILQRINIDVFKKPEIIEANIRLAADHLHRNHPGYFFMSPASSVSGKELVYDAQGFPWRLFPYLPFSFTLNSAETTDQAFQAAAAFGRFGHYLSGCPVERFHPTIDRFHDLSLRYQQFQEALTLAPMEKKTQAHEAIRAATQFSFLADRYDKLIKEGTLVRGVFHNDTKINNVLFDSRTMKTLAVIDLDTLMPGYFIYDLGDLLRTVVCPVSEEEQDLDKIVIRREFYEAVMEGYLSEMKPTPAEKQHASFAAPMMTYIMALRFLADYLRGDTYYHITYPGQNLVRAKNQLRLLELFLQAE